MKVSIIIPTYNEAGVIRECLESLSKQTYKQLEVIVVDDGSTDKTLEVLQNFQFSRRRQSGYGASATIFNFQILREAHKGPGAARNLGTRHAKGEILVFVDADMTFEPNFIEKLVEPILQGKAKGTFSKEEYVANKDNIWARLWNLNRGLPPDRMHPSNYPDTQKVFRAILKAKFDRAGGFNEKAGYTDDWSLSDKLGIEAVNAAGAIFYHRNPSSLKEVFIQSKWMAKRKYKLGIIGVVFSLLRTSLPLSFLFGVFRAFGFQSPRFLIFKLVSDFGAFWGILEYSLSGNPAK